MTLDLLKKIIPYFIITSLLLFIFFIIHFIISYNILLLVITIIVELMCLSGMILYLFINLRTHINILERQSISLHSAIALSSITINPPVFFLRHAVAPDFVELIVEIIRRRNVCKVLELGCGTSSIYIASLLSDNDIKGQLICLEDNKDYADFIQLKLDKTIASGDSKQCLAKVIYTPLIFYKNMAMHFYDINLTDFEGSLFDLLLIDGPADVKMRRLSLPLLRKYLTDNAIVIVDDGDHLEVRNTIKEWLEGDPYLHAQYYNTVKGTWVLFKKDYAWEIPLP